MTKSGYIEHNRTNHVECGKTELRRLNGGGGDIPIILGNASMLRTEQIPVQFRTDFIVQRWERDAGDYGSTALRIIGTAFDPSVAQSHYVATAAGRQNFVLGWNSMVQFTGQEQGFEIGEVVSDDPQYPARQIPSQTVEAVVTRGVATCTAVVASNGSNFAFLHLDKSWLPWGMGQLHNLNAQWRVNGGITNIFISYIDDRNSQGVAFAFANNDVQTAFPNAQLRLLNRGILKNTDMVHSEIGLGYAESGDVELFGDMLSPHLYELLQLNMEFRLGDMNTDPDAADFSRYLFSSAYPNVDIVSPERWPNFAPEREPPLEAEQVPVPVPQAEPGLLRRFISWITCCRY